MAKTPYPPIETRPELARRRLTVGMTQTALAALLGIRQQSLNDFEHGTRPTPAHIAEKADVILTEIEAAHHRAQSRMKRLTTGAHSQRGRNP